MKSKFSGYFKLTDEELKNLWGNALFVFDANILLNLYRYSDDTREDFLKVLEKIKDRIWIPYQSANEFFENRLTVIDQQEKAYDQAISSLRLIEDQFKNARQHPFVTEELLNQFSTLSEKICEELGKSKKIHNNRIYQDEILNKIESLFNNRVGDPFDNSELGKIYEEAAERFLNKVPPGFKDIDKNDNTIKNVKKYGDVIVWKQIIEKSKESKIGIIFITDDRKEDWWVRFKGKTLNPRPELKKEFQNETEQLFHMYQSDRFLEFASNHFNENINDNAIKEIRDLMQSDEIKRLEIISKRREDIVLISKRLRRDSLKIKAKLHYLNIEKESIEENLDKQYNILKTTDPSTFNDQEIRNLKSQLSTINSKIDLLKFENKSLQMKIRNLSHKL